MYTMDTVISMTTMKSMMMASQFVSSWLYDTVVVGLRVYTFTSIGSEPYDMEYDQSCV